MDRSLKFAVAITMLAGVLALGATLLLLAAPPVLAAAPPASASTIGDAFGLGLLAAALSTGLAALGAGYAVAKVSAAAVGALAEKPELFGRLLIFVGLAEGIAIYGLIVSILILNRLA
jgi:V/A-type H+-transporting ATPase subunit K